MYSQTIAGRGSATEGEAKNSWLTGTAAWNFVAVSQWILGIRAEHSGLRVDPVVPASWPGFRAVRQFRGATYRIAVSKPAGAGAGRVTHLLVDGARVVGSVVPLAPPGATVQVQAVVG